MSIFHHPRTFELMALLALLLFLFYNLWSD